MRRLEFKLDTIRDYYHGKFSLDLNQYFKIEQSSIKDVKIIKFLDAQNNGRRVLLLLPGSSTSQKFHRNPAEDTCLNFIFAGIFYFMVLIPQTIGKMLGKETEYEFYRATGWPLISAGLGGQIEPSKMLKEAGIYPEEAERENFVRMLSSISPFMFEKIRLLLEGKEPECLDSQAYQRLTSEVSPVLNDLLINLTKQSMEFSVHL